MNCRPISRGRAVRHLTAKLVEAIHRLVAVTMLLAVFSAHFTSEQFGQSSRHLYKVTNKDNKVGFIDKTGKLVIGFDRLPAEAEVGSFSEGFAPICFRIRLQVSTGCTAGILMKPVGSLFRLVSY